MALSRFGLLLLVASGAIVVAVHVSGDDDGNRRRRDLGDLGLGGLLDGLQSRIATNLDKALNDPNSKKTIISQSVVSTGNETKTTSFKASNEAPKTA